MKHSSAHYESNLSLSEDECFLFFSFLIGESLLFVHRSFFPRITNGCFMNRRKHNLFSHFRRAYQMKPARARDLYVGVENLVILSLPLSRKLIVRVSMRTR